jgi:hypothetical protein
LETNPRPTQESQHHGREIQQGSGNYEKQSNRDFRNENLNKSNVSPNG